VPETARSLHSMAEKALPQLTLSRYIMSMRHGVTRTNHQGTQKPLVARTIGRWHAHCSRHENSETNICSSALLHHAVGAPERNPHDLFITNFLLPLHRAGHRRMGL